MLKMSICIGTFSYMYVLLPCVTPVWTCVCGEKAVILQSLNLANEYTTNNIVKLNFSIMRKFFFFAALLSLSMMSFAHDLCCYYGSETHSANAYVTLSWQTAANGDVVITIGRGPGATSASFRNGGFEGGIDAFVVSTDNFENTVPASNYFTATQVYSGDTYTLVKVAEVPAGAQIKHVGAGHAFAWKVNGVDAYSFPDFIYTYGENCGQWDAPANVAVSADSVITFTAVEGAEQYTAYIYLAGVLRHEQVVNSGDVLHFSPMVSGTYQVNVVAFGNGMLESNPSADVDWALTAPEIVIGASEYCGFTVLPDDNREAQFTWETNAEGAVIITVLDADGNESEDFHFRGNGMALGSFMVGSAAASTYFNHACTGNTVTLSLKDAANTPIPGEKLTFNAVVEYATALDTNAWPTIAFEYTYGSVCEAGGETAVPQVETVPAAEKIMRDGVLYIRHNGILYNVLGTSVK